VNASLDDDWIVPAERDDWAVPAEPRVGLTGSAPRSPEEGGGLWRSQLRSGLETMAQGVQTQGTGMTVRALESMDRIDRGEDLPDQDDPLGARYMNPEQRAGMRARLEQQVGENLRRIVQSQEFVDTLPRDPNAQPFVQALDEGRWGDAWRSFTAGPGGIVQQLAVESLPNMAPAIAAGLVAGPLGAVGAGFLTDQGPRMTEILGETMREAGVNTRDPAAMQAWMQANPGAVTDAMNRAGRGAGVVGAVDGLTQGLARPIVRGLGFGTNTRRAVGNAGREIAFEGVGEAGAGVASGQGVQAGQIVAEMLGAGPASIGTTAAATAREMAFGGAPMPQAPIPNMTTAAQQPPLTAPGVAAGLAGVTAPGSRTGIEIGGQTATVTGAPAPTPSPSVAPPPPAGTPPPPTVAAPAGVSPPAPGAPAGAAAPPGQRTMTVGQTWRGERGSRYVVVEVAPDGDFARVQVPSGETFWVSPRVEAMNGWAPEAAPTPEAPAPGAAAVPPAAPIGAAPGAASPAPGAPSPLSSPSPVPSSPSAAPPAVVDAGRPALEALLNDPRPAAQIEQDRAAERQRGIDAMQQGLPPGWSVLDEDGAISVLDPNGEWSHRFDDPPSDPADLAAEVASLHQQGLQTGIYSDAVRQGDGTRAAPVQAQNPGDVDAAAGQAAPAPTPAQAEAGNYRKGHLRLHGLDVTIENERGSTRSGVGADGRPWSVQMPAHYGYVKGTTGRDGDQVDVYLGPQAEDSAAPVFIVDQVDADTGRFDEHKVMLGFDDTDALPTYLAAFNDGRGMDRMAGVTRMTLDEFKAWVASGAAAKGPLDRAAVAAGVQRRRAEKARVRAEQQAQAEAAAAEPEGAPAGSAEMVEGVAEANGLNLSPDEVRQAAALVDQGMSPKAAILQVTEAAAQEAEGEAAAQAEEGSPWREVAFLPRDMQGQPDILGGPERGRDDMDTADFDGVMLPEGPEGVPFADMTEAEAIAAFRAYTPEEQKATLDEIAAELDPQVGMLRVDEDRMRYRALRARLQAIHDDAIGRKPPLPKPKETTRRDTRGTREDGEADAGAGSAPAEADGEGAAGTPPPGEQSGTRGADTGQPATELTRLARAFGGALIGGRAFASIAQARTFAAKELGRTVQPGTSDAKMVDEAVEAGVVMAARLIVQKGRDRGADPAEIYRLLVDLYGKQPRVGVRTADSIERQAYSTPAPLAYIASQLAGIGPRSSVYEPTAGTGMLLIGASPGEAFANELDPTRRAILDMQGFATDDQNAVGFTPPGGKYDAVIANPPFGAVRDGQGQTRRYDLSFIQPGYQTGEVDHAIALRALQSMKDDGEAVLILGGIAKTITDEAARANAYNGKAKREFFFTLYRNYRVVDHFTVSGELYAKQGAAWPVDVIVIRGRGRSDLRLPSQGAPRIYSEWSALEGLLNERNRDDRSGMAAAGGPDAGVGAAGQQPGAGVRPGDARGREGRPDDAGVSGAPDQPGAVDGAPGTRPAGGGGRAGGGTRGAGSVAGGGVRVGAPGGAGGRTADGQSGVAGLPEPAGGATGPVPDAGAAGPGGRAGGAGNDAGGVDGSGVQPGAGPDVAGAFDGAFAELFGEDPPTETRAEITPRAGEGPAPSSGQAAASAVKNAASGADDAMSALTQLFGGGKQLNTGLGWNEDTWKAAKPLFLRAIQKFRAAAADARQAMLAMMKELRDAYGWTKDMVLAARAYMERFVSDVVAGRISLDEGAETAPASTPAPAAETAPAPKRERKKQDEPTDRQVPYEPRADADGVGTLVPVNMQTAVGKALAEAEQRAGRPLVEFVADRLDYSADEVRRFFSAEQIDALALAIDNVDRDAGFVIGDQTGVGKGRFVAAMIRYAQIKGLVPIFVTEKPNLYADMARDLTDIGMADALDRIVPTNSSLNVPLNDEKGGPALKTGDAKSQAAALLDMAGAPREVAAQRKIIFTTYSQLQQIKGDNTPRIRAIEALAPNAFVILDESHNAGGAGVKDEVSAKIDAKKGRRDRGAILRGILRLSRSAVYSSATWAKRPDVMDLYGIKTDMRLAVPSLENLAEAISRGGVPMQQIVSAMMAQSGQYIRRERSFAGVTYDLENITVDRDTYDAVAGIMAGVFRVSKIVQGVAKGLDEEAKADAKRVGAQASDASVESMNFGAVMHNLINQMLLASKAPGTVRLAIERLKNDQKPVIALANTMGSFIEEFAQENNASPGDRLDLTFNSLLDRYLRKTLILKVKKPFAKKEDIETIILTPDDLGPDGEEVFRRVEAQIRDLDLSAFPVSPIDFIRAELAKAGYTVGEITGRTEAADYRADGGVYYRRRPAGETTTRGRLRTISGFNGGEIDAIILNQSGATGLSLHASEKFKDQRKRVMLIAQAEANIDTHMQMLGRVHRTGQVITPAYLQLVADVPAEKRPAAVLAKKMASLAAATTANRRGALGAEGTPDFINEFGDRVVAQIVEQDIGLWVRLGEPKIRDEDDSVNDAARRVTGRIPLLPLEQQEALYEQIEEAYRRAIQMADEQGNNTLEAKTLDLDARLVEETPWTDGKGGDGARLFEGPSTLGLYDVRKQTQPPALYTIVQRIAASLGRGEEAKTETLKGMSRDDLAQTLYDMAGTVAERWAEQEILRVERTAREAGAALEDKPLSQKERDRAEQRIDDQRDRLRAILREAWPSAFVRVTRDDASDVATAMVLHITPPKKGNRNAPGSWEVGLLFPDGRRMDVSAASVFTPANRPQSGKDKGDVDVFVIENVSDETDANDFLGMLDTAASDRRERRYIVTGNLLAGFAKQRGQILNFYDADGAIRQGIMLSADFDLAKFEKGQRPSFMWADAVDYLSDRAVPMTAAVIETSDGNVKIARNDRGAFVLTVPESKREGADWFMDGRLQSTVSTPFVSASGRMRAQVSPMALREVMRRIGLIATGKRLELTSQATEAKGWLEARRPAQQPTPGGPPLYANPFDPALFNRLVMQPLRAALGGSTALNNLATRIGGLHRTAIDRVFRDPPLPANTTEAPRPVLTDLNMVERFLKTPERMFSRFPPLLALVRQGMRAEQNMQVWRKRLTDEYETIRTTLRRAKGDWQNVAEALYAADAEGVDLDNRASAQAFYDEQGLTPAEATAAADLHTLLMKQGRLVDQHRRAMLPTIRARKQQVWKRMEDQFNRAKVDSDEYQKKYRRRTYLHERIRAGKGDLAAHAAERDRLSAELRDLRTQNPEILAAYEALREEYDALEARLVETSIRGRIKGYFPHKFFGQWRLFRIEKDADGKDVRVEITSDQGFYDSRGEAIIAARAYAEANPGARLHIEPRKVSFPEALSGTPVSDTNYRRISKALAKEAGMGPDEVRAALKGTIRKRSRRRVLAAAMKRKGAEGFAGDTEGTEAEMADRVLRTHINQIVRYVTMDRLKMAYVNTTERMGLSPGRQNAIKQEGRLQLFNAVEAWWRDVNGAKQGFEEVMDSWLQRMGLPGSTLAAAAIGATGGALITPYMAPVLSGYLGYRMFQAMRRGGEFPTRSFIGSIVGDMAHLKLGMFVNIASAAVNLTQTAVNTYPLLGEKWTAVGMQRAAAAMWSMARNADAPGRMSEDAHILRRLDVVTDHRYTEENEIIAPTMNAMRRLSMFWFERAERMNRATAAMGAYHRALDGGASAGEAFEAARELMTRTQFHQGLANRPELLRQQWSRLPLQFWNFMFQQIAFFFGLRNPAYRAFDPRSWLTSEVGRMMIALFVVAGALGLAGLQILDWLLKPLLDDAPTLLLRLWAIDKGASAGPEVMSALQVLLRGFPALANVDITERVGMGKGFLPEQWSDFLGAGIGSLVRMRELARREAPLMEQLGAITPAFNQAREIAGAVTGDPRTSGFRRGYVEDEPTSGERVRAAIGVRPLGRSLEADVREGLREDVADRRRDMDRFMARIVAARREGRPEEIGRIRQQAMAAGITLSQRQIMDALRDADRPRADRDIRRTPRDLRPDVANRMRAVEGFRGAGP
jgi:predicted RNA methylase